MLPIWAEHLPQELLGLNEITQMKEPRIAEWMLSKCWFPSYLPSCKSLPARGMPIPPTPLPASGSDERGSLVSTGYSEESLARRQEPPGLDPTNATKLVVLSWASHFTSQDLPLCFSVKQTVLDEMIFKLPPALEVYIFQTESINKLTNTLGSLTSQGPRTLKYCTHVHFFLTA